MHNIKTILREIILKRLRSQRQPIVLPEFNSFELGYLSGFCDGDGYLFFGKEYTGGSVQFKFHLILCNTNLSVLMYFKKLIRYGTISSVEGRTENAKPVYKYVLSHREALESILPLLKFQIPRKEEGRKLMIEALKITAEHRTHVTSIGENKYKNRLLQIDRRFRELNKRGRNKNVES